MRRYVVWRTEWSSDEDMTKMLQDKLGKLGSQWRVHSVTVLSDEILYLFESSK